MRRPLIVAAAVCALAAAATGTAAAGQSTQPTPAARAHAPISDTRVRLDGMTLSHHTAKGPEVLTDPDDITRLGGELFVGFQNGVGPQGQPSTTGNRDSTIVEFPAVGRKVVRQWDIRGKCDGLTADPVTGRVIATVNEDAHSSLYLIDPATRAAVHYHYNRPLPSRGGTDAITIDAGRILISASAPGTTGGHAPSPSFPAVYIVRLRAGAHVADISPLFGDEAAATVMNAGRDRGARVHLALTDPDSNELVPAQAHRFAGDFMLTSQGDKEQIFVSGPGTTGQRLGLLRLSQSVDDTVWATDRSGAIYADDTSSDRVMVVHGPFTVGDSYVAVTPCDANGAPTTCPARGYPANYLGRLNPDTGRISRVAVHGFPVQPQGMQFVP